jgi:hypothetical protein
LADALLGRAQAAIVVERATAIYIYIMRRL